MDTIGSGARAISAQRPTSTARSDLEPRVSPKPFILILAILGWTLNALSDFTSSPLKATDLGILVVALSAIAWLLADHHIRVGGWFLIGTLVVVVLLANDWLQMPGSLSLMVIPTALAAALLGLAPAAGTALGETLLLLLLPAFARQFPGVTTDWVSIGVALGGIWAVLGVMFTTFRPVDQATDRAEAYLEHAQEVLEETRENKAELAQALADLANSNRQLALAGERMAALRAVAEEAQKAKTMFVAKVSHEFRTPLNMIVGLVGLIVEAPEMYDVVLPPEMSSDLQVVYRNSQHLANLVNDVLNLTQMEAGRLVLHREGVDLRHLVDSAVTSVRPLVDKKGLFHRVEAPDNLPQVYCDATRIQQVVLNLVSNAARFTSEGGITIRIQQRDQHVLISVADTGPGISPENAERIFEPFCQGTSDMWRDSGGSGLGLTISKQFVQLHGGRMWLESELGIGSNFFFELPISPPVGHIARPGHQIRQDWVWRERAFRTERGGPTEELTRPRLVVCDESGALYPQLAGHADKTELVRVRDLSEAAEALRQYPAHALVVNVTDPQVLISVVKRARTKIPENLIIGCSVPRPVAHALEAGATGYLTKPVTRAELERAIRNLSQPVRRVLIVDDDPDVLRLFTRMLRAYDETLAVTTAHSGEQALDEVRRNPPDLVLLDVVMPGKDGWQVLERLRQDDTTAEVSVLFVSAQDLVDRPPESELLVAAMGEGLSISQLLRCSLALPELLLRSEVEPGSGLPQTAGAR